MSSSHKFNYEWRLSDGYPEKNGLKVMSTFCCGGGSSMGYKLAGYDVVAANDIDREMMEVYLKNNHVEQFFLCPIKELMNRDDLPKVDILDGSPPCSLFSTAGNREKDWGKLKKFREGQSEQVLNDLFFDFLDLVKKMRPRVVVAENVKGMLLGKAKGYVKEVARQLESLGYTVQVFLLDASTMGVPSRRERVFFIANLDGKKLTMDFNEPPIPFKKISNELNTDKKLTDLEYRYWREARPGGSVGKFRSNRKAVYDKILQTITSGGLIYHPKYPRELDNLELCRAQTFPIDYDFIKEVRGSAASGKYVIGMSVPPVMMAQIATNIYLQIFKENKNV